MQIGIKNRSTIIVGRGRASAVVSVRLTFLRRNHAEKHVLVAESKKS